MGLGLRLRDRLLVKLGTKESLARDVLDDRSSGGAAAPTLVSISISPSPGVLYRV